MKRVLSFAVLLSLVIPAFAVGDSITSTYVGEGVEEYSVTIPAAMSPGDSAVVSVSGTWLPSYMLTITADSQVEVVNSLDGDTRVLDVTFDGISKVGANTTVVEESQDIFVEEISDALFGTWSGVLGYNVSMESVDASFELQSNPDSPDNVGILSEYSPGVYGLLVGEAHDFDPVLMPLGEEEPVWASSNPAVATVTQDGLVTAVSYGEADITYMVGEAYGLVQIKVCKSFNLSSSNYSKVGVQNVAQPVVLPAVFNDSGTWYKLTSVGGQAFKNTTKITWVTFPSCVTSIATSAFDLCSSLQGITVEEGNPAYMSVDDMLYTIDGQTLVRCPGQFTEVNVLPTVKLIASHAFSHCTKMESITLPEGVTTIDKGAFWTCSSLRYVNLPSTVSSIYVESAFSACPLLTEINVAEGNSTYKSVNGVLYSADGTTLLTWPKLRGSVVFEDGVTTIGNYAFSSCSSFFSMTIPDTVTSLGDNAFSNCRNMQRITIPASVTSIGDSAFASCVELFYVRIPDGITVIGTSFFQNCQALSYVVLPSTITTIKASAFKACDSLTDIYFLGTEEQWNEVMITATDNDCLDNVTMHFGYVDESTLPTEPPAEETVDEAEAIEEASLLEEDEPASEEPESDEPASSEPEDAGEPAPEESESSSEPEESEEDGSAEPESSGEPASEEPESSGDPDATDDAGESTEPTE